MNGPEHYNEAERLLNLSSNLAEEFADVIAAYAAQAQVHATLALVAAIANRATCDGETLPLASMPISREKNESGEDVWRNLWQEALR